MIKKISVLFLLLCSFLLICACSRDYKVTFYYGDEEVSQYVKKGSTIEDFIPTMEGYTFDYWLYDGSKFDVDTKIDKNMMLYAYWVPNDIKVTYVYDESDIKEEYITSIDVLREPTKPTKDDYIFLGWFEKDASSAYTFNSKITSDITLYAKWVKDDEYTPLIIVSFNSTGAKVNIDSRTIKRLDTLGELPTLTREGYTFLGWFIDDKEVDENYIVRELTDFTLIAKWKEGDDYDISFDSNGGESLTKITVKYGSSVTLPTPDYEGYDFQGWYLGEELINTTFIFEYKENITLVARWKEIVKTYELSFDTNGGLSMMSQHIKKGGGITLLTPTFAGHEFDGWYLDGVKVSTYFTYNYDYNITLVAKWKSNEIDLVASGNTIKYYNSNEVVKIPTNYVAKEKELRAVWVSSYAGDFSPSTDKQTMMNTLSGIIKNLVKYNFNAIIFHVRTHNNAFYQTKMAPIKSSYGTYESFNDFDYLEWFIDECHKNGIEFHAWMNPYRINSGSYSASTTTSDVANEYKDYPLNPASKKENILMTYTSATSQGAILNPCKEEVQNYIVDMCKEFITKYDVDAIHFDDYFYATLSSGSILNEVDQADYEAYIKNNPTCGFSKTTKSHKQQWRRNNVSNFIQKLHNMLVEYNKGDRYVQLGISPTGIYKNGDGAVTYDQNGYAITSGSATAGFAHYGSYLYADTVLWANNNWIDYLIPQTYWSIDKKIAGFSDLARWWSKVFKNLKTKLYLGIGIYMSYTTSSGSWYNDSNETFNQLKMCSKYDEIEGVSFYNYRYFMKCVNDNNATQHNGAINITKLWKTKVETPKFK